MKKMKTKILIDMDGTLCLWNPSATMSDLLGKGYFIARPKTSLVKTVKILCQMGYTKQIYIISAVDRRNPYSENEKRRWLQRELPEIPESQYLFPACGESKREYAKKAFLCSNLTDALLIDDYSVNLDDWAMEGKTIKFLNGFNASHDRNYRFSIREGGNPLMNAGLILNATRA